MKPSVIIDAVCNEFGVLKSEIMEKRRTQRVAIPRHVAMSFMLEFGLHENEVGPMFNRDRTSALYAREAVRSRAISSKDFKTRIEKLRATLGL